MRLSKKIASVKSYKCIHEKPSLEMTERLQKNVAVANGFLTCHAHKLIAETKECLTQSKGFSTETTPDFEQARQKLEIESRNREIKYREREQELEAKKKKLLTELEEMKSSILSKQLARAKAFAKIDDKLFSSPASSPKQNASDEKSLDSVMLEFDTGYMEYKQDARRSAKTSGRVTRKPRLNCRSIIS